MSKFNIFANLDDFASENNQSLSELEHKADLVIFNGAYIAEDNPSVQAKRRGRRNIRQGDSGPAKKKPLVIVDLDLDDTDDCASFEVASVPGVGQRTSYRRLDTMKKNVDTFVKPAPKLTPRPAAKPTPRPSAKPTPRPAAKPTIPSVNPAIKPPGKPSKRSSRSSTMIKLRAAIAKEQEMKARLNENKPMPIIDLDPVTPVTSVTPVTPQNDKSIEFDEEDFDISLKLKWEGTSNVERIPFRMDKQFAQLIVNLSTRENIEGKFFLLMLDDNIINQDDTPRSINYTIGKFIAIRILDKLIPSYLAAKIRKPMQANSLEFKIQTLLWKKPRKFIMRKTDPFKILTVIIAEELKCQPRKLRLKFDGDILDLSSTPVDHDFDGGEILDLVFRK